MPGMREDIFRSITPEYVELCAVDVELLIKEHPATHKYKAAYADSFEGFRDILSERLVKNFDSVNSQDEEERISEEIFRRMNNIKHSHIGLCTYENADNRHVLPSKAL